MGDAPSLADCLPGRIGTQAEPLAILSKAGRHRKWLALLKIVLFLGDIDFLNRYAGPNSPNQVDVAGELKRRACPN
jgi:hypothetical protein